MIQKYQMARKSIQKTTSDLKKQQEEEEYIHTTKLEGRKILQHIIQRINHLHSHSLSTNE